MPTITNRIKVFITVTALILVSAVIFFVSRRSDEEDQHEGHVFLHAASIKLPTGWGYDILAGDKKFIHQAQIPGVAGRHPFGTEEEAMKTGRLVVYKISHNLMPSVSVAELDSLGVSWKK